MADEASLRAWLAQHDVAGYQQMLLVRERFGYPDHLLATADELLAQQYDDRGDLRPILDAIVVTASGFGEIDVRARKTYTTLLTPRRTFAAVSPTTKRRVDLVLQLDGVELGGRLLGGRNSAGDGLNLRIALASVDDFDDEAAAMMRAAYDASL